MMVFVRRLVLVLFVASGISANEPNPTALPFQVTFEEENALRYWIYDQAVWDIEQWEGNHVLRGQGQLDKPLIVLGNTMPPWEQAGQHDLLIHFDFRLGMASSNLRMVFQHVELTGYNVLELLPGRALLKRDDRDGDRNYITERRQEIILERGDAAAPIRENTWHNVMVWITENQINVYLDSRLILRAQDTYTPRLSGGDIIFQANNDVQPVLIDNLTVQKIESASTHFGQLPDEWQANTGGEYSLGTDENNNTYLMLRNQSRLAPAIEPVGYLRLSCRLWNDIGGFDLRVTDVNGEQMVLDFNMGNLYVRRQSANERALWETSIINFYNRGRWDDFNLRLRGDMLAIYRDGEERFNGVMQGAPLGMIEDIQFTTQDGEQQRLDDCLFVDLKE